MSDWQELVTMTGGAPLIVERVGIAGRGVSIEGAFELPQLARLDPDDQVFVAAFVKSHGSIKEMERVFGVSYPTIKARLNRIGEALEFVETVTPSSGASPSPRTEILNRLDRGEIDAAEAIRALEHL